MYRNAQRVAVCLSDDDCCVIGAKYGDKIEVRLKYHLPPMVTVASFVYREGTDTYYISPTRMYKTWSWFTFGGEYMDIYEALIKAWCISKSFSPCCILVWDH